MHSANMQIESINVGVRERLSHASFRGVTGIRKRPVTGPVRVGLLGLEDDAVVNTRHHGGPDQAVYLYRSEDYAWWSDALGSAVPYGQFGDNCTLTGLPEANLDIGTRLDFGAVVLEVTAPRIPCNTLAACMGDASFVRRFVDAERPGLYCRVINPGVISAGLAFTLQPAPEHTVSTLDLYRARYHRPTIDELRRYLRAPIDARSRATFERDLAARTRKAHSDPGGQG